MKKAGKIVSVYYWNLFLFLLTLLLSLSASSAEAQTYHKNFGHSRVVRQNQTGLFYSDPSYISCGALSRSARGLAPGMTVGFSASSAPPVRWGSFVRQPGDGLYNGSDGTVRMANGAVNYNDVVLSENMMQIRKYMIWQQRQQYLNSRIQQRYERPGNFYVPGSNGGSYRYGFNSSVLAYSSYK